MCLVCFAAALITGLELSLSRMATGASLSLTPPMMVVVQLFLSWLLYWYTAMALRENVLKVSLMLVLINSSLQNLVALS